MKRTQLQLEEELYDTLRERAFREQTSMAALIRTMLAQQMKPGVLCRAPKRTLKDFSFIGSGASRGRGSGTIAACHDEELEKDYDIH
ncbi:MAG: ribbon-helix-helix protein, CopG family [Patescibacteria group bacterium]